MMTRSPVQVTLGEGNRHTAQFTGDHRVFDLANDNEVSDVHTYILIHFEGFGRDRSRDLYHVHTPYPPFPQALQSRRELLLGGVYPVAGGISGNR